jgi:hypothetical protein
LDEAVRHLKQAVEIAPDDRVAREELARTQSMKQTAP